MWLFSEDGFYSVVQHRSDESKLLVRARVRDDLVRMVDLMFERVSESEIVETPDADYPFRMIVLRSVWNRYLNMVLDTIDYDNFKDRVHQQGDRNRDRALMQVWSVMNRLGQQSRRQAGETQRGLFDEITG